MSCVRLEQLIDPRGCTSHCLLLWCLCFPRVCAFLAVQPENLLVDENGVMKITDFGVSSMKGGVGSDLLFTACGTPYYCAPEIINGAEDGYSGVKIDAWSCGIILYLLLTGMLPFQHDDMTRLYELINACNVPYPSWMSSDAKDLISKLLVKNPDRRYSLEQVKEHPWFRVDYPEPGDSQAGGEDGWQGTGGGGSDSGRSKGSSRSRKHSNPSMHGSDGGRARDAPDRSGSGSGSSRRARQGSSGNGGAPAAAVAAPPPPPAPKKLAAEYEGKDMDVFVRDALPGKPSRKIDEVVKRLEEIDIDCVDDIQCVAETVQTPAKLTKWLEDESKMPSVTAMRITKMFFP